MDTTHGVVRGMHTALSILGDRFMPNIKADIKVARLLVHFTPIVDPLNVERNKMATKTLEDAKQSKGTGDIDKLSNAAQQEVMALVVLAQQEWDNLPITLELPDIKIDQNDLPKERTGDDGWKNGSSLGSIIAGLGELFEYPKDGE